MNMPAFVETFVLPNSRPFSSADVQLPMSACHSQNSKSSQFELVTFRTIAPVGVFSVTCIREGIVKCIGGRDVLFDGSCCSALYDAFTAWRTSLGRVLLYDVTEEACAGVAQAVREILSGACECPVLLAGSVAAAIADCDSIHHDSAMRINRLINEGKKLLA